MKKAVIAAICIVFLASLVWSSMPATAQGTSKDKTLTFMWEQELHPDLAGWKLYEVTQPTPGGAKVYTHLVDIPYTAPATTFQSNYTLQAPVGQTTTKLYVLTAFDTSGNQTEYSNEASVTVDFQPPPKPMNLRITIQAN